MKKLSVLSGLILTGLLATPASALTPEAKNEIGRAAVDYLKENPESFTEIIQSVQDHAAKEQEKQQLAKLSQNKSELFQSGPLTPVLGNPNGTNEVVLFMDPFCHFCRKFEETITSASATNKDLKIIARDIAIMHPKSILLIKAMLAASKQGKYSEMQSELHKVTPDITEEDIQKIADKLELNKEIFQKDMENKDIEAQIKSNMDLAENLDIAATPSYVVKGQDKIFAGYLPVADFQKILQP